MPRARRTRKHSDLPPIEDEVRVKDPETGASRVVHPIGWRTLGEYAGKGKHQYESPEPPRPRHRKTR